MDNEVFIMFYKQMSQEELQKAYPITYIDDNKEKNYGSAIFIKNGIDFVGQTSLNEINNLLNKHTNTKITKENIPTILLKTD